MSSYKAPERNTAAFISSYHSKKVIEADHTHSESGVSLSASNTFTGSLTTFNNSIRAAYDTDDSLSYFSHAAIGSNGNFSDHAYFGHLDQISTGTYGNYAVLQSNVGATYVGAAADQDIGFRFNNSTKMLLSSAGKLGVNNTSPAYPVDVTKLNVSLSSSGKFFSGANSLSNTSGFGNVAIRATGDIVTSAAIGAYSDARIKKDIVEINDASSLEKLRLLKPSSYKYTDPHIKGTESIVEGFIAQEVRQVLPYAVNMVTDYVPTIYQQGTYADGIITLSDYDTAQLEKDASDNVVSTLRLYDASDNEIVVTIKEVISATELRVDTETSLPNKVFVYGQKVDDFHYLDKQAIFTVGISALQEVDRQLQAEKAKTVSLETQMASLLERVSALET
jgi:hypothetical protein